MTIRHVVLDFDGTCTQVPPSHEAYLDRYLDLFRKEMVADAEQDWATERATLHALSPEVGWMLNGAAPSAPAAADPYILAGEVAKRILRARGITQAPAGSLHSAAYDEAKAPWRQDAPAVLQGLFELGVTVHFVSNSSTTKIEGRLAELMAPDSPLRKHIVVEGNAAKFSIEELPPSADPRAPAISEAMRARYEALDPAVRIDGLRRPVYLRRGKYFEVLNKIWKDDPDAIAATLVCGDVWELDLAMPAALGCQVHLVTRQSPYETCAYELRALEAVGAKGRASDELGDLLGRVRDALAG